MTSATLGGFKFSAGTNASPSVLTNLEEVLDASGVGETAEQKDVTNWDSPAGSKEFIAGLAEGDEFTVDCNYISDLSSHQAAVRAARGATLPVRFIDENASPQITFSMDAVYLGWTLDPNTEDQNRITFRFKVSGNITEA